MGGRNAILAGGPVSIVLMAALAMAEITLENEAVEGQPNVVVLTDINGRPRGGETVRDGLLPLAHGIDDRRSDELPAEPDYDEENERLRKQR